MAFQLVEELGGMTVGEFLSRCSADELRHWRAYYAIVEKERKRNQKR